MRMVAAFFLALVAAALLVSAFSFAIAELIVVLDERAGAIGDDLSLGRSLRHALPFLGGEGVAMARTSLIVAACGCAGLVARAAARRTAIGSEAAR